LERISDKTRAQRGQAPVCPFHVTKYPDPAVTRAANIKKYFEVNPEAIEVLIFKGKKIISIDKFVASHLSFYRLLKKRYE
jgi:ribosomal protein L23